MCCLQSVSLLTCSSLLAGVEGGTAKKVDLETMPLVNGVPLNEFDLETLADKPWRLPGEGCRLLDAPYTLHFLLSYQVLI